MKYQQQIIFHKIWTLIFQAEIHFICSSDFILYVKEKKINIRKALIGLNFSFKL